MVTIPDESGSQRSIKYDSAEDAQVALDNLGSEFKDYVAVYVSQQRAIADDLQKAGWYLRKSTKNEYLIPLVPEVLGQLTGLPVDNTKQDLWESLKDEIIQDAGVDSEVNRDAHRFYPHIYVYWWVIVDNTKIRTNEIIYKGQDEVDFILSRSIFDFRERHKDLIGKPLSDAVTESDFIKHAIITYPEGLARKTVPESAFKHLKMPVSHITEAQRRAQYELGLTALLARDYKVSTAKIQKFRSQIRKAIKEFGVDSDTAYTIIDQLIRQGLLKL